MAYTCYRILLLLPHISAAAYEAHEIAVHPTCVISRRVLLDPGPPATSARDEQPMVPIAVEEPTVRMAFGVNKSPLAGREGKFLTTRMIRDRLMKELDRNVALRVDETDSADVYEVQSACSESCGVKDVSTAGLGLSWCSPSCRTVAASSLRRCSWIIRSKNGVGATIVRRILCMTER